MIKQIKDIEGIHLFTDLIISYSKKKILTLANIESRILKFLFFYLISVYIYIFFFNLFIELIEGSIDQAFDLDQILYKLEVFYKKKILRK